MRRVLPALILLGLAALAPQALAAHSLSLRPESAPVEDKVFYVVAAGEHQPTGSIFSTNLQMRVKLPSKDPTCGPNYFADSGDTIETGASLPASAAGPFSFRVPIEPAQTGPLLICAWNMSTQGGAVSAAALTVDVRAPRLDIRLTATRRPRARRPVKLRIRGDAEVPRIMIVRLVSLRASCGQSAESQSAATVLARVGNINGPIAFDARTRRLRRGTYTACVYIQESPEDARAEKVVRRLIRVR